ncbi:MAG: low temperature requirement protein A [Actinobacteria bacterium]|nr:MAG: low temperature requirement protein A [Actinomycetota bacterium]
MMGVMATATDTRVPRLRSVLREGEGVMPLELFFDLVFVLAITQCTALMFHQPTWEGLAQGTLVLGVLWWSWTGYAWLTSVLDPEEGAVRIVIFAAMAAFLIVAICVPEAFGQLALEFALAYGAVRAAHIALFMLASRDDPALRQSVTGLAVSTAIGVALLVGASFLDGLAQAGLWALALLLDMGGPFLFGAEGWKLVPGHFAERHGLIIIIALGESIVAIGAGAAAHLTAGIAAAAVLGITLAAAMWWVYFDVVALVSARRLARAEEGRERNELARDSYSYMHFPMVAGIVLVALGLKKTLGHVEDPLDTVLAFALLGGVALYLLGLVGFRFRHIRSINRRRLLLALVMFALLPAAVELPALATLALVTALMCALITYETISYGEGRARVRHEDFAPEPPAS